MLRNLVFRHLLISEAQVPCINVAFAERQIGRRCPACWLMPGRHLGNRAARLHGMWLPGPYCTQHMDGLPGSSGGHLPHRQSQSHECPQCQLTCAGPCRGSPAAARSPWRRKGRPIWPAAQQRMLWVQRRAGVLQRVRPCKTATHSKCRRQHLDRSGYAGIQSMAGTVPS